MNRLLTGTAVGLLLGLTPALAQNDTPVDESQTPPAVQDPAIPPEIMPSEPSEADPAEPSDPATPVPGQSSEIAPDSAQPGEASPPPQSSEAPKSIAPDDSAAASVGSPQFLSKQESSDWLASDLIGQPVVNAKNEGIGAIKDLVTDEDGKIIAAVIGHGGFLGLGAKDVAVRFEDLKFARNEDNDVTVTANLSNETLASAPDYETLAEQQLAVGAADQDTGGEKSAY
jgi:hypothetical protein